MTILLVEDDDSIGIVITAALEAEGFAVARCETLAERDRALETGDYRVLVTDVMLPDGDGIEALPDIRERFPQMPIIVLSAQNTLDTAVRATDTGAFEYFPKPFDIDELARTVRQAAGSASGSGAEIDEQTPQGLPLVGRSAPMQAVYRMITRVLRNDLTVLILGESGTGKELVARALHRHSPRADKPFIAINTAAIPKDLLESELFGHERGAFTGAQATKKGRFEMADGGTLLHAPDVYMEKIAIGPGYPKDLVDLDVSPAENILRLAKAKGVKPAEITALILDRTRHADMIEAVRKTGALENL